jgi:glycosyltransferase involved in cell wall biosynthesis
MPEVYRQASCLVLASLPTWHWEEQFGMVLLEAVAAGLPIVASASGAIPEVVPEQAACFNPGDWVGLAGALRDVVSRPPGERVAYDPDFVETYSSAAAAERLAAAYERVLRA